MPNSSQLRSSVSTCTRLSSSRMRAATGVPSVGTLWSAVASVRSGRRTVRPARRRPSKACGLVTSWTRCRSMYSRPGRDLVGGPDLVEQRASASRGRLAVSSCAGRRTRRRAGPPSPAPGFSKWWGRSASKVTQSPAASSWRSPSMSSTTRAALDERDLAAAGLVHRRVAGAAGARAGREHVAAELGALAGQRRGEDLDAVARAARAAAAALAGADDRHRAGLVEAQQLADRRSSRPAGDPAGDGERRARLAALDLAEHRRADAASARRGRAATGPSPRAARGRAGRSGSGRRAPRRSPLRAYVIAYAPPAAGRQAGAISGPAESAAGAGGGSCAPLSSRNGG